MQTPEEKLTLAKAATRHLLDAICDDPAKYWLMGVGTESWAKLTTAHAALWDVDVETVREDFRPNDKQYERYCTQRDNDERLLDHCREQGITIPSED